MIVMTRNNTDLQAHEVHHSIAVDWEVYMGRHHGIDPFVFISTSFSQQVTLLASQLAPPGPWASLSRQPI